jgi:hypothetical protein
MAVRQCGVTLKKKEEAEQPDRRSHTQPDPIRTDTLLMIVLLLLGTK